jgi:hypothetical protein
MEKDSEGKDVKIIRYGMWGVTAEIERRGRKFVVIRRGKKNEDFKTLEEAELFLRALL